MKDIPNPESKNSIKKQQRKQSARSQKEFPVAHALVKHLRFGESHPIYCAPFRNYQVEDDGSVVIEQFTGLRSPPNRYRLTIAFISGSNEI